MVKQIRANQTEIKFPFVFSDGVFASVRIHYGNIDDKKENPKDLIEHLSHRIAGYKGEIKKLKKQIRK